VLGEPVAPSQSCNSGNDFISILARPLIDGKICASPGSERYGITQKIFDQPKLANQTVSPDQAGITFI
jgi:hypothetical protein